MKSVAVVILGMVLSIEAKAEPVFIVNTNRIINLSKNAVRDELGSIDINALVFQSLQYELTSDDKMTDTLHVRFWDSQTLRTEKIITQYGQEGITHNGMMVDIEMDSDGNIIAIQELESQESVYEIPYEESLSTNLIQKSEKNNEGTLILDTRPAEVLYKLGEKAWQERRYEDALTNYLSAANQQYAPSYRKLATIYHNGRLGKRDYYETAKWLRKSCDLGDVGAIGRLGQLYVSGRGVDQDNEKGWEMIRRAAEYGDACSQYELGHQKGLSMSSSPDKWICASAIQGNSNAQMELAEYLYASGMEKDAIYWYEKSAMQEHPGAQLALSIHCFENGNEIDGCVWLCVYKKLSRKDMITLVPSNVQDKIFLKTEELREAINQYRIDNWDVMMETHF